MDEPEQRSRYVDVAKFAAGSAIVLLVSLALCGLLFSVTEDGPLEQLFGISLLGIEVGTVGLVISAVWAVAAYIYHRTGES